MGFSPKSIVKGMLSCGRFFENISIILSYLITKVYKRYGFKTLLTKASRSLFFAILYFSWVHELES